MASEKINIDFGNHLCTIRNRLGMTQEEVGDVCGIGTASVGRLERGGTNATLTTLSKLAKGLKVSLCDLVDLDKEYNPETIDAGLLDELQVQMAKLNYLEQKYVLEFIEHYVILKRELESSANGEK